MQFDFGFWKAVSDAFRPLLDTTHYLVFTIAGATKMIHRRSDEERSNPDWTKLLLTIVVVLATNLITGVVAGWIGSQITLAVHSEKIIQVEKRQDRIEARVNNLADSYWRNK